jgi:hypothetical protein
MADRAAPCKAWLIHVHIQDGETSPIFGWADGFDWKRGGLGKAASRRGILVGLKDGRTIDNPPFTRWVQLSGWDELSSLGNDAARMLEDLPAEVVARLWSRLPYGTELAGGLPLWTLAVFEVAGAKVVGSPLRAVRMVPNSECSRVALDSLGEWYRDWQPAQSPPQFPDWFATLDNFAAASVHAIIVLMSWLDVSPSKSVDPPLTAAPSSSAKLVNDSEEVATPETLGLNDTASAAASALVQQVKAVYISYAWGDDRSKAGRQRGEVVERLCDKLTEWGYKIDRDTNRLRNGDRVSKFMKEIGRGNRVLVVLSKQYLLSPNCMTELFYVYQHSIGDKEEFLRRVIPVVVDDARRITETDCDERVKYARHWQRRFEKMEPDLALLGEDDLKRYRLIKQWHAVIGDILGFISDELHPHGFDNIVKDDFAAVRELLDKYHGV